MSVLISKNEATSQVPAVSIRQQAKIRVYNLPIFCYLIFIHIHIIIHIVMLERFFLINMSLTILKQDYVCVLILFLQGLKRKKNC